MRASRTRSPYTWQMKASWSPLSSLRQREGFSMPCDGIRLAEMRG